MNIHSDEHTCRICLTFQDITYSLNLKRNGTSAKEKLDKIGLNIFKVHSGPISICCDCLRELEITIKFLEKCQKTNKILAAKFSEGTVINKEIERFEENLRCESDNNSYPSHNIVEDDDIGDHVVVNSTVDDISVTVEQSCSECGSKRRCAHWSPPTTHTCPYCHKVFNRKYSFKLHLKRHTGSKEWWCTVCGARTVCRSLARAHCAPRPRRTCPVPSCRRTYTTGTNLRNHMRSHTGERPFECNECSKTFSSKDTLKNHMRIHTGALPYICPYCGKQFRTNKLSAHMRAHGREEDAAMRASERETHTCLTCGAIYRHKQSLRKHYRKHHQASENT